jgi:hypothetical protein
MRASSSVGRSTRSFCSQLGRVSDKQLMSIVDGGIEIFAPDGAVIESEDGGDGQ